jgi:3-methyladenine DNA glycosylase AlkD
MIDQKIKLIHDFCVENTNPANIAKYSKYFKEGFDGYGIDQKAFEQQRDQWIADWHSEMTLNDYLDLSDVIVKQGKYEEISFAISFIKSERKNYTAESFDRIGNWFEHNITNWATTDVLCMLVLSGFLIDKVVTIDKLSSWGASTSEWQRRTVPVTLNELIKNGLKPIDAFPAIRPLMPDDSQYVQKGIGTLLRGLWKLYPDEVEPFLLEWKDQCGRLIIQYATEKMDKEYRKKFRRG